jgi:hypothetical protein
MQRSLTEEELLDAERLSLAWDMCKHMNPSLTQAWLAKEVGFGQSAFSHYLNGITPLGLDALVRICVVLRIDPMTISPRLYGNVALIERSILPRKNIGNNMDGRRKSTNEVGS